MRSLKIGDKIKITEIGETSYYYPCRDIFKGITFIVVNDESMGYKDNFPNGYNEWNDGFHSISVKTRSRNFYKKLEAVYPEYSNIFTSKTFHIYSCKSELIDNSN